MFDDIYLVGSAWTSADDAPAAQLDEVVFDTASRGLRSAGVNRHQVDLSITSSLDLYDARSISSALTAPAAAGYLTDELRVEGDAGAALLLAMAGLQSGSADYAIVVAVHSPEVGAADEAAVRDIDEHVSSYTFDAHCDRPVGMTANVTLGLHAAARLDAGAVTFDELAARTAEEITRGSSRRGIRAATTADEVGAADTAVAPLTGPMLPAASAGIGVLVLASGVAGRRCPRPLAKITGWGKATAPSSSNPAWITDPYASVAMARKQAYERAGLVDPSQHVSLLEMTDLSPALTPELLLALDLEKLPTKRINPSGGVRSNHPGIANGVLRVVEAADELSGLSGGSRAVVHSTDALLGLISSTSSVLVLEAL